MDKSAFRRFKDNSKLDVAGVYILYSTEMEEDKLYIGEGDDVRYRLKQHSAKRFWKKIYIFTSDRMNVAFSKNIEYKFILKAKIASRYKIINKVDDGSRKLGKDDLQHLETHLANYYSMVENTDFDIFQTTAETEYIYINKRTKIKLIIEDATNRKVTLLAGSCIDYKIISELDLKNNGVLLNNINSSLVEVVTNISTTIKKLSKGLFDKVPLSYFKNKNSRSLYIDLM